MKNILLVFLISSGSIFANAIKQEEIKEHDWNLTENSETALYRTKCQIVRDNIYQYCIDHGYSQTQATSIANAAEAECKKVSIQ